MIKIIGLGPGDPSALTIGAMKELEKCQNIYLRTEMHPTVSYLKQKNIKFKTYDYLYENSNSFDEVYENIANDLVEKNHKEGELVYAVPGHPLVAEKSVVNLINICKENNISYKLIPSVSFIDVMMERLEIDPIGGLEIVDAFDLDKQILNKRVGVVITQVYSRLIASEVKIQLGKFYNDDTEIIYCRAVGIEGEERIEKIPLYELDMQDDIDHLTSVYIPKDTNNKKDIYDLFNVVETLRGENGCPWDREQTHESIKKAIVEESYEVMDAINNKDVDGLIEELGDVLLQVVFHSVIEKEEGYFEFSDIIEGECNKMIFRHPHVFGDKKVKDSKEVISNWEELKKKEKHFSTVTEELEAVAKALPALIRAQKVQKKANKVGFDMKDVTEVIEKLKEEFYEVLEVYKINNKAKITEEVGDLLFSCVNLARFLGVDSEEALNYSTNKFIKRFKYIEETVKEKNIKIENMNISEMNKLWDESKKLEK